MLILVTYYTTQDYFELIRSQRFLNERSEIAATCLAYLSFDVFLRNDIA